MTVSGTFNSRVFNISGTGTLSVDLSHLAIVNGVAPSAGGGIQIDNEIVTITDCIISGNRSTGNGGGIALLNTGAQLNVTRTVVSNNRGTANGGGLDTGGFGATVSITDSSIVGNTTTNSGGGLGQAGGTITFLRTTLSGNSAGSSGALYLVSTVATFDSCTISGNTTSGAGGGINFVNQNTNAIIRNSTITANSSVSTGGGINRTGGSASFTIISTIVAGNAGAGGVDINFNTAANVDGNNNLIGIADVGNFTLTGSNNLTGSSGAPLNPLLGPLANNGGLTFTQALLPGSPAIDAGSNPVPQSTDQRGFPREAPSGLPDIGASNARPASLPPLRASSSTWVPTTLRPILTHSRSRTTMIPRSTFQLWAAATSSSRARMDSVSSRRSSAWTTIATERRAL